MVDDADINLLPLSRRASFWTGIGCLAVLGVLAFVDLLFQGETVVSAMGADLSSQYLSWRHFGFEELSRGNLALWNPYLFCGVPFFAGFQSALLYPPNWLHMIAGPAAAINVIVMLHVVLMGAFMYAWAWHRGLSWAASLLAGVMMMFGGTFFMHVHPGHLSNLSAMPWIALVLAAVDGVCARRSVGWCLAGVAAIAMLILAGHPQYVFYTAIACGLYAGLLLIHAERRPTVLAYLAIMAAGGALITTVQWWTGLDAAAGSVRADGVPFEFAAMFSFPPENLLTLLAPGFFGDLTDGTMLGTYWGRAYLWEMSLFAGVTGLALAVYAAVTGRDRRTWICVAMVLVLFVLALGSRTPLFKLLYNFAPGFDTFRSSSKFMFQASLFFALLAAQGLDRLLRSTRRAWTAAGIAAAALATAIGALIVAAMVPGELPGGAWHGLMTALDGTLETYSDPQRLSDLAFVAGAARSASASLWVAAAVLAIVAGCVWLMRFDRRLVLLPVAVAVVELFVFARSHRPAFELSDLPDGHFKQFFEQHPGEYRVLNEVLANVSMITRVGDIWGYDPGVSRRYAQFMTATQGGDPDQATQYLQFTRREPFATLYPMLRQRFVIVPESGEVQALEGPRPMRRLHVVQQVEVIEGRDAVFARLLGAPFNPRRQVILEQEPAVMPDPSGDRGTAELLEESTDHLLIRADLPAPAILLVTDGDARGWTATGKTDGVDAAFDVLPADWVLRAIPLAAGHHEIRLEYRPRGWVIGRWISAVALLGYAGVLVAWALRRRRRAGAGGGRPHSVHTVD